MKYEIEMIDVKAADAFLIHYVEDNGESHIIMVDSGNYDDADKISDNFLIMTLKK